MARLGTGGSGSAAAPYGSAQTAIDKAPSGSTIVLRGGTYRESIFVPKGKQLTIRYTGKVEPYFQDV